MERKLEDTADSGGPCWEDYPPLLTIAQTAAIMQMNSRAARDWLAGAGLIIRISARRARIDKAEFRLCLQNLKG